MGRPDVAVITAVSAAHTEGLGTLADVARVVHISPLHFCRIFKEIDGRTVHKALTELRVLRLVESIIEGDAPALAALAPRLGFSSPSHLTTTVSATLGVAPSRLRSSLLDPEPAVMRSILQDLGRV